MAKNKKFEARDLNIKMKDTIIPMYDDVLKDILAHKHTHYVFPGGRGSTKSSFVGGIVLPLLIMLNPQCHAVVFRKIGNTIQKSTRAQVEWGIYKLGLEEYFDIPKVYSNPITFIPTGQEIIFMGLDDPNKVKSIKLPFGYIGVTWWEELDQFAGENELRKALQSTMRGGNTFWDFRTFNPPISKNNWANEYTDLAETRKNTLVVRNTYLDVPKEWLGEQFFEEAEELKEINPKAYEHEYMGIPIGTGGDVFQNASDFNMKQLVDIPDYDEYGNPIVKKVPLWQTFDQIYCGIDWGFAKDPFRFVRMHFDAKKLDLYIFKEYSTLRTRNEVAFDELYNQLKLVSRDELVTADSAEEKSIADFKAYGAFIRGAEKGPDSVRYGIKWLQGLRHIYIDKRMCPETYKEFINYEYEQDRDGNFVSAYPDANNHSIDAVRYAMEKYWKRRGH
jgi:PBSX family phage terminase large subunit